MDTKREYLDGLAKRYKSDHLDRVTSIQQGVTAVLDEMHKKFGDKDELLSAQGIQGVYYLVFRTAQKYDQLDKTSRFALEHFRQTLATKRNQAAEDYEDASFELLEFDRLNQQGTNDASSIKERYSILCNFLGLPIDDDVLRTRDIAVS